MRTGSHRKDTRGQGSLFAGELSDTVELAYLIMPGSEKGHCPACGSALYRASATHGGEVTVNAQGFLHAHGGISR